MGSSANVARCVCGEMQRVRGKLPDAPMDSRPRDHLDRGRARRIRRAMRASALGLGLAVAALAAFRAVHWRLTGVTYVAPAWVNDFALAVSGMALTLSVARR